mgnify:CR=1 FL=1
MANYAKVINRKVSRSLPFPPLAEVGEVLIHFICTYGGAYVLNLWRNGHAYQVSISKNGQSVIVASDNGKAVK